MKKDTVERINQTLSIKSRTEEALRLEEKRREITEQLESLIAQYAKATGKKNLKRKSKKETETVFDSVKDAVKGVRAKK
jgi:ABC-type phosphate transport system auxiliary subunit